MFLELKQRVCKPHLIRVPESEGGEEKRKKYPTMVTFFWRMQ